MGRRRPLRFAFSNTRLRLLGVADERGAFLLIECRRGHQFEVLAANRAKPRVCCHRCGAHSNLVVAR